MSFQIALSNVLISLFFAALGFILQKWKKDSQAHLPTLSAVLVYICSPFLIISSFISLPYSVENLTSMLLFFATSFVLQAAFMLILFLFLHKKYGDAKYRIITIGSVLGNVGFFGLPVVKSLFPDEPIVACYSAMYVISMNLLVFTVGVFCLTGEKKYISLRSAILNPSMLGFAIGLPLFIFSAGQYIPEAITSNAELLGRMSTPLCMIILGIRLGSVKFSALFCRPSIYAITLGKLLVYPLFAYLAVYFLPFTAPFKACILILSAAPCASIILNLAEIHEKETELAANYVLITTLLCVVTIPLLALLI